MKSLAIAIAMNLALSSPSTVVGMPHALGLGFHGSLGARSAGQVRHSALFGGRLIEAAPKKLVKRDNVIDAQFKDDGYEERDNYNDDDDDNDTCEKSFDSTYAGHRSTPNLHTGLNSTSEPSPNSKSPLGNSFHSATEHSAKPTDSTGLPQISSYESWKKKHHTGDSHKFDVSSDKYVSDNGSASKHHGSVGSYFNGHDYHGKATFFSQGGSAGACGKVHQDSDFVVAIQSQMYHGGEFCGKSVNVTRKSTGKSLQCVAADECPGCPTDQSLDLSIAAFNALGSPDEGVFDIQWHVMD